MTDALEAFRNSQEIDGHTSRTLHGMLYAAVRNQDRTKVAFPRFIRTYQPQFEPGELRSSVRLELDDSTPLIAATPALMEILAEFEPEMIRDVAKSTMKRAAETSLAGNVQVRVSVLTMADAEELRTSARSNPNAHLAGEIAADAFTPDELGEVSMILVTADVSFSLNGIHSAQQLVSVFEQMRAEEFFPEFVAIDKNIDGLNDIVEIADDYAVPVAVMDADSLGPIVSIEVAGRSSTDFFAL